MTSKRTVLCAVWALVAVLGGCTVAKRAVAEHYVNAIAGIAFAGETARLGLIETRSEITQHVALAAGLAYFEGAADYEEMQLRLSATGSGKFGSWIVDNRHLLSFSTESVERYRCRLRTIRPGLLGQPQLSVRAFDEVFFDFDRSRIVRNNVAVGIGVQLPGTVTAELYHVWVGNREARDETYMLAVLTFRI